MSDIKYSYDAVPTIRDFSSSNKFIRGLMGPFGSGKSSGCVIELVKWASKQPVQADGKRRARFAVIRNTYPQLRDTTLKTVLQWLPDGPTGFSTYTKSEHVLKVDRLDPALEIEILFRALDRPEHVANLLSLELTGAWINEAREIPKAVFNALQGRVGRYPSKVEGGCVDPGIICDTNPPDTDGWWYELFEERKPDNCEMFRQPGGLDESAENMPYLPDNYYQNMVGSMDEDEINVYVNGEYGFLKDGKPVFPGYKDAVHCRDIEYVPGLTVYRGWDFGLTPAVAFSQVLPDGTWNTFDELVAEDVFIDEFSDSVVLHSNTKYPKAKFYDVGDPSGSSRHAAIKKQTDEDTCFKILHGKGIMIEGGPQDLTTRLESVRKALRTMIGGEPQLAVHSRCKTLRKGYQGQYKYKSIQVAGAQIRYRDEPDKNDFSHIHDGNQYTGGHLFGESLSAQSNVKYEPIQYRRRSIA